MEIHLTDKCGHTSSETFRRIGQSVNIAIERLTAVGEKIADKNMDIKQEMYEACKEAIISGTSIERMCCSIADSTLQSATTNMSLNIKDIVKSTYKSLIGPITRVLLLADIVVVKQLLISRDNISKSIDKLESVFNFTEFVAAFFVLGGEMVDLANLMGDRSYKFEEERRCAQIVTAKKILEHSTAILFTSTKTCLIHPECPLTKENRDTVFCQIRRAMDFIHFIIKDGVKDTVSNLSNITATPINDWTTEKENLYFAMDNFSRLMHLYKKNVFKLKKNTYLQKYIPVDVKPQEAIDKIKTSFPTKIEQYSNLKNEKNLIQKEDDLKNEDISELFYTVPKESLLFAIELVIERTNDLTDSAYTNQDSRERIILLRNKCKLELEKCLTLTHTCSKKTLQNIHKFDEASNNVLSALKDLSDQIITSVNEQMFDLNHSLCMTNGLLINFRSYAINQEIDRFYSGIKIFHNYCDHVLDVCKLFHHIAAKESLQEKVKFLESNMRLYGPQILNAARIVSIFPSSNVALENFDTFLKMWRWISDEIMMLCEEIIHQTQFQAYLNYSECIRLSSPKNQRVQKKVERYSCISKDETLKLNNSKDNSTMVQKELEVGSEQWSNGSYDNNDIMKRTKNMSSMAFLMYQFTNGNSILRTTQDLFTQAEYFAEEANRLYKVVRQFSYQVPAGKFKKDLLEYLDKVPTYVQALQYTVKEHTVGKAATFVKVDHVIQETKNLMNAINKVTGACIECANEYKLNISTFSGRPSPGNSRDEESGSMAMGETKGSSNITEGSM